MFSPAPWAESWLKNHCLAEVQQCRTHCVQLNFWNRLRNRFKSLLLMSLNSFSLTRPSVSVSVTLGSQPSELRPISSNQVSGTTKPGGYAAHPTAYSQCSFDGSAHVDRH